MIISLANPKGGVGKSTLAVNLAVEAIKDGWEDIAILELDLQRTAYLWAKLRDQRGVKPPVQIELVDSIETIEGGCAAYAADKQSLLIVDCAGADTDFNRAAVAFSDMVIIPTRPSQIEVFALTRALGLIQDLGKVPYILNACAFPAAKSTINDLAEYIGTLGGCKLMSSVIRYRAAYQHSFAAGKSVTEYARDQLASLEIAELAKEINQFLKEVTS